MRHRELFARRRLDHLRDPRDVARFVGIEAQAERFGVGDHIKHPAIGDVDRYRSQAADLDRRVEMRGECRDIAKRHKLDLAIADFRLDGDESGRGVELEVCHRFHRGHHARFDEHRHYADGVGAGHRRILHLLHDDEAGVGIGMGGR